MEVTTLPKPLVQRVLQGLAKGAGRNTHERHGGPEKMIAEADGAGIGGSLPVRFDEREVETEQGRSREAPPGTRKSRTDRAA